MTGDAGRYRTSTEGGAVSVVSQPLYLCADPDECQGHYRRCPHNDVPGRYLLACSDCHEQRVRDGVDMCRTDDSDGLPLALDAYRSVPS